jgi:hypothetical protein
MEINAGGVGEVYLDQAVHIGQVDLAIAESLRVVGDPHAIG